MRGGGFKHKLSPAVQFEHGNKYACMGDMGFKFGQIKIKEQPPYPMRHSNCPIKVPCIYITQYKNSIYKEQRRVWQMKLLLS